jgi:hypothetical protein
MPGRMTLFEDRRFLKKLEENECASVITSEPFLTGRDSPSDFNLGALFGASSKSRIRDQIRDDRRLSFN